MGPRRDIVAEWQRAAARHGLRFGITEHLAASWWFYSPSKGADQTGPKAGVPYDGNDPRYADLYWPDNHRPSFRYYGTDVPDSFKEAWYRRIAEIVDLYHPDLLYSDSPLPYPDDVGRRLVAHYYNADARRHGGRVEAVYTCKEDAAGRWVRDIERGVREEIAPEPWQTDTCIGNWYYQTGYKYKTSAQVVHMLADIVSKNGNLLLNFPQRPDGTLDEPTLKIIADLGDWMAVNSEAIHGTRPWQRHGEGPTKLAKGRFGGLSDTASYTAADFRFTTKAGALYAIALGWPADGRLLVKCLAPAAGTVAEVALLGHAGRIEWRQTAEGLEVRLPAQRPCDLAYTLKITGLR
jgi:alpha-L-fucosidase